MALAVAPAAHAQDIFVNTTTDEYDSTPGNGTCDSPSGCSLRAAVTTANGSGSPGFDYIHVPAGTFHISHGIMSLSSAVTIQGAGARSTVLDADATSAFFTVTAGSASIIGLTMTDGKGSGGGAVLNGASTTLWNVAVVDNESTTVAGGVYDGGTNLTILNSTIAGNNAATVGGGLYVTGSAEAAVINSTVAGNQAGANWNSGGIYNDGTLDLASSTVAGNGLAPGSTGKGGGMTLEAGSTNHIVDSIVADNHADPGYASNCQIYGSALSTSQGHNIDSLNECRFNAPGDKVNADPLLGPLQDNGGPTDTMAIPLGSPAVDAGDPAVCPDADQRGIARPQLVGCDIGAFELVPPPAPPASPPAAPPAPAATDSVAPRLKFGHLRRESLRHRLFVVVKSSERALVRVSGKVSIPKLARVYRLKGSHRTLAAGKRGKLTLKIPKRTLRRMRRALHHHKHLRARIKITAKDRAGNVRRYVRTIKLKR